MGNDRPRILIVDDEDSICQLLHRLVTRRMKYSCDTFTDPEEVLQRFISGFYAAAIFDILMPKVDGLTLLGKIRKIDPDMPVIVLTALGQWETAVNAMRLGAFNFINKPFDSDQIENVLRHSVQQYLIHKELRRNGDPKSKIHIIGKSKPIRKVLDMIKKVSPTDSTVLITGESGTGKELVARSIHLGSPRRQHSLVALNCGAFPDNLLESELFGHLKGAFTSAYGDKIGMFEVADNGTFFLDEIGETSQVIQVKLLRVLETREIRPIGSTVAKKIDTRIIAATNRNLEKEVAAGTFRFDLFYRLNVIPIHIPPLRDRKEDIPLLVGFLISKYAERTRRELSAANISSQAWEVIEEYPWPGNIRELENVLYRAFTLMQDKVVLPEDLGIQPFIMADRKKHDWSAGPTLPEICADFNLEKTLEDVEIGYIKAAMDRTDGSITEAAKLLGVTFRTMRYKVRKYGLKK